MNETLWVNKQIQKKGKKYSLYGAYRLLKISDTTTSVCHCPSDLTVKITIGDLVCKFTCKMNQ